MVSTGEVKPLKTKYCLRTSSETFDLIMTQDASKQKQFGVVIQNLPLQISMSYRGMFH